LAAADDKYPLIVPEINGHLVKTSRLIANPNCTTGNGSVSRGSFFLSRSLTRTLFLSLLSLPLARCSGWRAAIGIMALYPLFKKYGLKRVIMSTYQASSGAGAPGMNELKVRLRTPRTFKNKKTLSDHPFFFCCLTGTTCMRGTARRHSLVRSTHALEATQR
jgi:aspartate-semialdehyde dehydrogenase